MARKSMEPLYRGRARIREQGQKGVVQEIIKTLQGEEAFREAEFRFGFRIYRQMIMPAT